MGDNLWVSCQPTGKVGHMLKRGVDVALISV